MLRSSAYALCAAVLCLPACGSEDGGTGPSEEPESLTLRIKHEVSGTALALDTGAYVNGAGNSYTVARLQYYVSGIELEADGGAGVALEGSHYLDGADPSTFEWMVPAPAAADYQGVTLHVGLTAAENVTGGLPNTTENIDMAWPDPMGGGYHFLKLEGHYTAPDDSEVGFALHIGGNDFLVTATVAEPYTLVAGAQEMTLVMDLNEWMDNPHTFDFDSDGNYTMNDPAAKQKLMENGADVFSLE